MAKEIEELSLEHYLMLYPQDKKLPESELTVKYNKWADDYIQEILASQYIDVWKTCPPYEL